MVTRKIDRHRSRRGRPKGRIRHSKMVLQRVHDTRALLSSIEVHKAQVAAGVAERLAPELADGEALPIHALSLELMGRSVERALERLRAAEGRLLSQQMRCLTLRRESEELARGEVYGRVVAVRRLIDSQFGKEAAFPVHGLKGKTLRKPRRLHGQLEYMVLTLRDRSRKLPPTLVGGQTPDREVWLRQLEPGYRRLTELLDELTTAELLEQGARDEKNAAMEAFDAAYGEALRLVRAVFAFAGCDGRLVKNLRSYVQKRLLSRRAREKRQARAEGRLSPKTFRTASSIFRWIGRNRSNVT